jgi:invasion protein IalB
MNSWLRAATVMFVFGGLTLAGALAQEKTTAKTPKPPPKPADAVGTSTTPAAGATPAAAAPKIQRTEVINAGNWTVTCAQTDQPNAKPRCSATLKITQDANNAQRVVFTWLMGIQDGKALSVVSIPPGILISPGVVIKVGAKEGVKFSYSLCQPDHCEAIVPLDEALQKELASSPTAEVSVVAVTGSTVKFTVNLAGFEQALAEVTK